MDPEASAIDISPSSLLGDTLTHLDGRDRDLEGTYYIRGKFIYNRNRYDLCNLHPHFLDLVLELSPRETSYKARESIELFFLYADRVETFSLERTSQTEWKCNGLITL